MTSSASLAQGGRHDVAKEDGGGLRAKRELVVDLFRGDTVTIAARFCVHRARCILAPSLSSCGELERVAGGPEPPLVKAELWVDMGRQKNVHRHDAIGGTRENADRCST